MKKNSNTERRRREIEAPRGVGWILDHEIAFFGAFWALYFTIQLPALRTESAYIYRGQVYVGCGIDWLHCYMKMMKVLAA